jgi:predicted  nucleic acid-binding Zn-ribbon protein
VSNIQKLLRLQQTDQQILRLKRDLRAIPQKREDLMAQLDKLKAAIKASHDGLMHEKSAIKDLELEVEATNELVRKYRRQQLEVKDNESYRALEDEIREANRKVRRSEDVELEMMERLEVHKGQIDVREKELQAEESSILENIAALEERLIEVQGQAQALVDARTEAVAPIDEEWLKRYESILQNKGDVAIVSSNNLTCGGCFMKIPPQVLHDSKNPDKITLCSYCGRMMYFDG